MTAKEKFYSDIKNFNAHRIESIKDTEVYATMITRVVYVFCHPDNDWWDMYIFGDYRTTLMIPQVLQSAFLDKSDMPDNIKNALDKFYEGSDVNREDIIAALLWLWNNTGAFDTLCDSKITHITYKDDTEPMTPEEIESHKQFFGELFLAFEELNLSYSLRFNNDNLKRLYPNYAEQIRKVQKCYDNLARCMVDDKGLLEDRYVEYNPEDSWDGQGVYCHSFKHRLEACYSILLTIKQDMDNEISKDEEAYGGPDSLVEQRIYDICANFINNIEMLRHTSNPDI